MNNKTLIRKASGEVEPFSQTNLENSLRKAGAQNDNHHYIVKDIRQWLEEGVSTRKIYTRAFALHSQKTRCISSPLQTEKSFNRTWPNGVSLSNTLLAN